MPSSRRTYCRRTAGLLLLVAGCNGRSGPSSTADAPATEPSTERTGSRTPPPTEPTDRTAQTTSLVLHDVDVDALPRRARVGVVSPETWDWVTTAAETGAADVEGGPYAVRTTYRAGEASYRLKTERVGSTEEADPPEATDTVANVSDLSPDQRQVARAAIQTQTGYHVGYHEARSEAFETVREYDYLRYEGKTYWTFVVHGDRFLVHTTLWADPIETADEDDTVFEVEPVALSERGRDIVTTAIESAAANVEAVPETLADAAETYDALATTTALYRGRLR